MHCVIEVYCSRADEDGGPCAVCCDRFCFKPLTVFRYNRRSLAHNERTHAERANESCILYRQVPSIVGAETPWHLTLIFGVRQLGIKGC